jgi:hypothetical protein
VSGPPFTLLPSSWTSLARIACMERCACSKTFAEPTAPSQACNGNHDLKSLRAPFLPDFTSTSIMQLSYII